MKDTSTDNIIIATVREHWVEIVSLPFAWVGGTTAVVTIRLVINVFKRWRARNNAGPPTEANVKVMNTTLSQKIQSKPLTKGIVLRGDKGELARRISATLGRHALMEISSEGVLASSEQFYLTSRDGKWFVRHNPTAHNETFVNDTPVTTEKELHHNDELCLGWKALRKMKLEVRFQ
jgi:hypothetical protein